MWERRKEEKKKEIQLQHRYNYKFSTRTAELFVRGTRPGRGNERKREKEEENGSFVEKLTTPFPRIAVAIVLTERTNNSTNCGPRPSVVEGSRRSFHDLLTTFSSTFFLPPFASRRPLSPFLRSAQKLPKNMSVRAKPDTARCARESTLELRNARTMKKRRKTCRWTFED